MRKHLALILMIGLSVGSLGAAIPGQGRADISGTWEFLFYLNKGTKPVTFVLKQQGEKVTGTCCTPEEKLTGTVQGNG